ncbi:DUF1566 domain-containing protein [Thiohalocapsa marina]|uniref:Lcl C-terminal domain-containing protein n=1 Tax=Thiohalocapsa marina TaxID=424902 RepID=UPI00147924DE|nr:DUF1566 domain-containing protein [Thiohalocapsa marina]
MLLLAQGVAQAALQPYTSEGANLVYSTGQDLTWTADANLFKTQCDAEGGTAPNICPELIVEIIAAGSPVTHTGTVSYPSPHDVLATEFNQTDGGMTWFAAQAWVAYLNDIAYGGATNWRLWEADPADTNCSLNFVPGGGFPTQYYGFGCTGTELGYLYYEEGGATPRDSAGPPMSTLTPLSVFANLQDFAYWSGTEYAPNPGDAWLFNADFGNQDDYYKGYQLYGWAVRPGQVAPDPQPIPTMSVWGLGLLSLLLLAFGRARLR